MRPSHPLLAPVNEWHTYSPTHEHDYDTIQPTPRESIATFQSSVCFQPTSTTNTHSITPLPLTILYHAITEILLTYNSPLVLTIDGHSNHRMHNTYFNHISHNGRLLPMQQHNPYQKPVGMTHSKFFSVPFYINTMATHNTTPIK